MTNDTNKSARPPRRLDGGRFPGWKLAGFSSLAVPMIAAGLPLAMHLPNIYASNHGVSLALIGTVFLLARIWDAFTDPIVAIISDSTNWSIGRRKPFIIAGGVLLIVAASFLFFPVGQVSPARITLNIFAFYFAWTLIQIPYAAWSARLSGDYHERTRIVAYQAVFNNIGLVLALILPVWLEVSDPNNLEEKLHVMGALVVISTIIGTILATISLPEDKRGILAPTTTPVAAKPPISSRITQTISGYFGILVGSGEMRAIALADLFVTTGQAIRASLIVMFVATYMGQPKLASALYLLQFIVSIVAAPIWHQISVKIGKQKAALFGEAAQALINYGLLLVTKDSVTLLLALTVLQGLTQGSGNLMLRSMVADVADSEHARTGKDKTAQFVSLFSLTSKIGSALGVGIALKFIGGFGFTPGAAHQTDAALTALLTIFALGPATAHTLAFIVLRGLKQHQPIPQIRQQHPTQPTEILATQAAE